VDVKANGSGDVVTIQEAFDLIPENTLYHTVDEGGAWFKDNLIVPLPKDIEHQTGAKHLSLVKEAVRIIHEEFDTDLTIESVAERLYYTASYVSTIFRKQMNVPFGTYLAQYRHQAALKWLQESKMPVKEIAERLRYNNSQNFIRTFRKMENISPGKYREQERGKFPLR
jgi:YesN/AraC family two-component response regulator